MTKRHLNEDSIEDLLRSDADLSERPENLTFEIFGRMVLNSYKLNCLGKPMTRYQYVVSIIRDITEEWLRMKTPSGTGGGGDAPDNQPAASSST
ncbi:hypothetical protein J6590_096607 [Homalodisca vitripennis]|nr:hypothetical protein J6590_096607 [Homalodisca vitripennis]